MDRAWLGPSWTSCGRAARAHRSLAPGPSGDQWRQPRGEGRGDEVGELDGAQTERLEAAGRVRATAVIKCPWWGSAPVRERRKGGWCGVRRGEAWPGTLS
jgi:hypothetical protein